MSSRPPVSHAADPQPSRRERLRQATIEEIKQTARAQMATEGPAGLSLRAVARAMNITPSALYRYFDGVDDLITALCVDAYHALGDAVQDAVDAEPANDHVARWQAYARGMRRWALANPADFALVYGTPLPGYEAPPEVTRPAGLRFTGTAFRILIDAVRAGVVDLDRALIQYQPKVTPGVAAAWAAAGFAHDHRGIAVLGGVWTILQGHLTLELFGHFNWLETDLDLVFDEHVRAMMLTMGFDPAVLAR
jgi:AcrR family transcriptional regulator